MSLLRHPGVSTILTLRQEYEIALHGFITQVRRHITAVGGSYTDIAHWLEIAVNDEALEAEILSKVSDLWPMQVEEPVRCRQPMP